MGRAVRMSEEAEVAAPADASVAAPAVAAAAKLPSNSIAIPFAPRPSLLDGTFAGDVGFDPMGFADTEENLVFYRTAEVKHGRLAMLAAAGWPLAEMWHPGLSSLTGMTSKLTEDGRVPSVLNGGLPEVGAYLLLVVALSAAFEMFTMDDQAWGRTLKDVKTSPGTFGFDPMNMYTSYSSLSTIDRNGPNYEEALAKARKQMELAEIKNGRLAMLGITGFAIQEAVTQQPVIQETPIFFTPFWKIGFMMLGIAV